MPLSTEVDSTDGLFCDAISKQCHGPIVPKLPVSVKANKQYTQTHRHTQIQTHAHAQRERERERKRERDREITIHPFMIS